MKYLMDFGVLTLLYAGCFYGRWKESGKDALLWRTLFYVYLSFVLYFTLMPVVASLPFVFDHPYRPMHMAPFEDVLLGRGDYKRQVALNILMTVPFGILFPLTRRGKAGFFKTVLACFGMSLAIELLQPLLSGYRSSDITDLITNLTGGILGYALYAIFKPVLRKTLDRGKTE